MHLFIFSPYNYAPIVSHALTRSHAGEWSSPKLLAPFWEKSRRGDVAPSTEHPDTRFTEEVGHAS